MIVRAACLAILAVVLAGCGGGGEDEAAQQTTPETAQAPGNHVDPGLEARLPKTLRGQPLETESYAGEAWLEGAAAITPGVDFEAWIETLGGSPRDLTVAWAKTGAVHVLAFRMQEKTGRKLAMALRRSRTTGAELRANVLGGKRVDVFLDPVPQFYAYVSGDVLYMLPADDERRIVDLLKQLP